jgi:hypothetical protein
MPCTPYDFSADPNLYHVTNTDKRDGVLFYARPATERRAFPLGILALDLFHRACPETIIHLAGADVSQYAVPFPYIHHGDMSLSELNGIYNQCSAALIISFTNMSLMPLELLAAGVVPVVTEGDNNQLVAHNPNIRYCRATPRGLADALVDAVAANKCSEKAVQISQSVPSTGWEDACQVMFDKLAADISAYQLPETRA